MSTSPPRTALRDPVPTPAWEPPGTPGPAKSTLRSALELLAAVAVLVALALAAGQGDLLLVIVCLVVIVMVHELGHYLAAKHGRMKVTEYFLGFGPRLWSFRRGETEYGIKALPLGGYVKIPGMTNLEEVDPADEARTYREQPFHARLLVAVAGSAMHFLMAFVLLWALLTFIGLPNADQVEIQGLSQVGNRPGPAQVAGVRTGDIVVSLDGRPVRGNSDALISAIHDHPGRPVTLVVDRDGTTHTLVVTPADGRTTHEQGVTVPRGTAPFGLIGVSFGSPVQPVGPLRAVASSGAEFVHIAWASMVGVAHVFSPAGVAQRFDQVASAKAASQATTDNTRVQSIVGVVQTARDAAQNGIASLLSILIVINVFFGIINLFPMLPLDGGHVAIAVYEKIRTGRRAVRYRADVARLMPVTWAFMLFLFVVISTALLNDIIHPAPNPFG